MANTIIAYVKPAASNIKACPGNIGGTERIENVGRREGDEGETLRRRGNNARDCCLSGYRCEGVRSANDYKIHVSHLYRRSKWRSVVQTCFKHTRARART